MGDGKEDYDLGEKTEPAMNVVKLVTCEQTADVSQSLKDHKNVVNDDTNVVDFISENKTEEINKGVFIEISREEIERVEEYLDK